MTDGTSQGLFIVVAIVIFGIFVVLAYILFEDTLSPAMASMFNNATEQASDRLENFTDSKYFDWKVNPDGKTITLTAYTGDSDKISIPEKIEGYVVTDVGDYFNALRYTDVNGNGGGTVKLKTVKLPKTLKRVGKYAFEFNALERVVIPEGVTHLGDGSFEANRITSVKLPESLEDIGWWVFGFNDLKEITVTKNVKDVDEYFIANNENLTKVKIPVELKTFIQERPKALTRLWGRDAGVVEYFAEPIVEYY